MVSIWEPTPDLREGWKWIEESGADTLWVGDHLWSGGAPGNWDRPRFDTWSILGALAIATDRVRLGSLVTSVGYRNPAVIARQAITIDHLSGGRFELGIGAGANPRDALAAGLPSVRASERERSFGEAVGVIRRFLREDSVTFRGTGQTFVDVPVAPRPIQSSGIPLIVAAQTDPSLAVAAELGDGWVSYGSRFSPGRVAPAGAAAGSAGSGRSVAEPTAWELTRQRIDRLQALAIAHGRDPADIRRIFLMLTSDDQPWASEAAFVDVLSRYREIGIDEFAFPYPIDRAARAQVERVLVPGLARLQA